MIQSFLKSSTMASSTNNNDDPMTESSEEIEPSVKNTLTPDKNVDSWYKDSFSSDESTLSNEETTTVSTNVVANASKNPKPCDFAFIFRPTKLLKHAIDALSEQNFNNDQRACIKVSTGGFEISVWNYDQEKNNLAAAGLLLNAASLEDFQVNKPLHKIASLKRLSQVFEAAEKLNKDHGSIAVYSVVGSHQLSFQWGNSSLDFALGFPVSVTLHDPKIDIPKFPDVSFILEATIESEFLQTVIEELKDEDIYPPEHATISIRPPDLQIIVGDVDFSCIPTRLEHSADAIEECTVQLKFKYWDSLFLAARMVDKCSVYLVSDPAETVLLRFDLQGPGDLMYLTAASFISVPALPCIGQFCSMI